MDVILLIYSTDFIKLKDIQLPSQLFIDAWEVIVPFANTIKVSRSLTPHNVITVVNTMATKFDLLGKQEVCRRNLLMNPQMSQETIETDFLEKVDMLLPEQPWPIGVHKEIASKLCCNASKVLKAIEQLIKDKKKFKQANGIVYDFDGKIIARDSSRCPYTIEELNSQC